MYVGKYTGLVPWILWKNLKIGSSVVTIEGILGEGGYPPWN